MRCLPSAGCGLRGSGGTQQCAPDVQGPARRTGQGQDKRLGYVCGRSGGGHHVISTHTTPRTIDNIQRRFPTKGPPGCRRQGLAVSPARRRCRCLGQGRRPPETRSPPVCTVGKSGAICWQERSEVALASQARPRLTHTPLYLCLSLQAQNLTLSTPLKPTANPKSPHVSHHIKHTHTRTHTRARARAHWRTSRRASSSGVLPHRSNGH